MASIELRDFLKWAFGEELVHTESLRNADGSYAGGYGSTWGGVEHVATLGCFVDGSGTPVDQMARRSIHPDAVAASEAVMLLAAERFDLPEGWRPFPDLDDPHGLIAQTVEDVLCRRAMRDEASLNANLIGMLISYSVLGKEPDWRVAQPAFRMVEKAGKPAWFVKAEQRDTFGRVYAYETDGYDVRAGRPKPGAFRKYELSEPFEGAVQARIDWYLWAMAMPKVAERLQTGLLAHQIRPLLIELAPWSQGGSLLNSLGDDSKALKRRAKIFPGQGFPAAET